MPRGRPERETSGVPAPVAPEAPPSTALALPDDVRADLLRAQGEAIQTPQLLPRIKMLPAGACVFEYDDTHETSRTIEGIVLATHALNVLWERPYGQEAASEEEKLPACAARDGKQGVPRLGFRHAHIGNSPALGTELLECRTCPYNAWNSKTLIGQSGKGKACTNQRAIYLMIEGRQTPMMLVLPPTSITMWDRYLATLLNHALPVQAVLTVIGQERIEKNSKVWAEARFSQGRQLVQEEFDRVLAAREQWQQSITPLSPDVQVAVVAQPAAPDGAGSGDDDGDDAPF